MFLLSVFLYAFSVNAQITDSHISHAILGRYHYEIPKILDSLGVWNHAHLVEKVEKSKRWYSIADGNGVVKVFKFNLISESGFIVEEVIVNYRHDSREQIEAMNKISDADNLHVGTYSTDLVFRLKK